MSEERAISNKRFWAIKSALIFFFAVSVFASGFYVAKRLENKNITTAMVFAEREMRLKHPALNLISDGTPFCYDKGNVWPAKIIPTKRSLMPIFKTMRAKEF